MSLFGPRQASPDTLLRQQVDRHAQELASLASTLRQLETEQINLHDQVRKWMRRAVAAERAAERAAGSAHTSPAPSAPAAPPTPPRALWGARARRFARELRERAEGPEPVSIPADTPLDLTPETNGDPE